MSRCRSCGRTVTWVVMPSGRRNPVEVCEDPTQANIVIEGVEGRVVAPGQGTHISHFSTCPDAESFRRR